MWLSRKMITIFSGRKNRDKGNSTMRDKSDAEKKSSNKIPIKEEDMPLTEAVTEPDTLRGVSPVRRGVLGNLP